MIEDFIGKEFLQHCGDSLLVLEKIEKRGNNWFYRCQFQKYPYEILARKDRIKDGLVFNPKIEEVEFIGKTFYQNCGDNLKVIKRLEEKTKENKALYLCQFLKYPYEVIKVKDSIIKGTVLNPSIEQVEFINKLWPQNCGDTLKIIKKTKTSYWECEFINYSYKIYALKGNILKGEVNNPQIDIIEFQQKEWLQNCGDTLKIIKRVESDLYEVEFIKYPCRLFVHKGKIKEKCIDNPNLPYKHKYSLLKIINSYKNKPTLNELSNYLEISYSVICNKINEFGLNKYIDYHCQREEQQIKEYIISFYKGKIEKYLGKKEDNYYEIDIYFPELHKGIEYNGSIWHEEGNLKNKFSKQIGYHKQKQELFKKKGIDILYIWDYEWFKDYPKRQIINEQTKQKIREFLGFN